MSWSRRLVACGALAALAACGFSPAYGPGGGAGALQGRVTVEAPKTRAAYLLTRRVEERLGRTAAGPYALSIEIDTGEEGLAIDASGRTTRYHLTGEAAYALRVDGREAPLAEGRVRDFTGYSSTGSTVATLAARRAAAERLMRILADRIVDRLILAAPDLPR